MSSELRTFAGAVGLVVAGLLASAMAVVWVLGTAAAVSSNDGPAFTYDDGLYLLWSMPEPSGSAEASATSPDGTTAPTQWTAGHVYDSGRSFVAPRTTPGTAIEPMWAQAPNRGFLGGWSRADTLEAGTVIDRYGGETGRFFSPQGTPLEARSLPAGSGSLNSYEVLKPLHVQGGVVAPAFGQPGLGIQYMTDLPVADLIEQGFLKAVG